MFETDKKNELYAAKLAAQAKKDRESNTAEGAQAYWEQASQSQKSGN